MSLSDHFPDCEKLISMFPEIEVLNVNAHIHTPYSFSAFRDIPQIFEMARKEQIAALGINDFFVTDGYETFQHEATLNGVFPLFNIEFIGLLEKEQKQNIRINDPNNPGRCYFCGKGLRFPFNIDAVYAEKLNRIIALSQDQMRAMIKRINDLLEGLQAGFALDYDEIKSKFAKNLVRERHLAQAIRIAVHEKFKDPENCHAFLKRLFDNKTPSSIISDIPGVENEIRSNLLKSGGKAFVEEDASTFIGIDEIINIIRNAGGIPCYPVLLDDKSGNYTEYERSPEELWYALNSMNINCIEFIPGRNDIAALEKYIRYFHNKGFIILLGTEHNTPEMMPLTCTARNSIPLSDEIKKISYEGTCIVAAHQLLTATGHSGYSDVDFASSADYYIKLGNAVIQYRKQFKN